jgi:hypothetical protein
MSRRTPEELVALVENNENRISEIFDNSGAIRHYLYVSLLRPEILQTLLPSVEQRKRRDRIQRYIRAEFENVLGSNGDRFNNNSTKELYDEFKVVLERHIHHLRERKREQGKNSNSSTTRSQGRPAPTTVRRARRVARPAQAASVAAPVPAPVVGSTRRRSSSSPDELAVLLGDMNVAPGRRQQTPRQRSALQATRQREAAEAAEAAQRAAAQEERLRRRGNIAETRESVRESVRELNALINQFRL